MPPRKPETTDDPTVEPLPFDLALDVERLERDRAQPLSLDLGEEERARLAGFLGVEAVRVCRFEGRLAPWGTTGWQVRGRLTAQAVQPCVVTLEPVVQEIAADIARDFLPAADLAEEAPEPGPREIRPGDEPDPFADRIDVAQVLVEALALAVEPYPRKPGVAYGATVHAAPGVEPLTDADLKPFAGLAALKRSLGDDKQ